MKQRLKSANEKDFIYFIILHSIFIIRYSLSTFATHHLSNCQLLTANWKLPPPPPPPKKKNFRLSTYFVNYQSVMLITTKFSIAVY